VTIFIDPTENRASSRLPDITDARVAEGLETMTGADILISPLRMPAATEKLVSRHVKANALLVQRKSGEDLIRSIGTRIPHSLARMRMTGAAQWQCVLLSTGVFCPDYDTGNIWVGRLLDVDGTPDIAWHLVKWPYKALATEIRRYHLRGGVYVPLTCDDEIPGWCRQCEADLIAMREKKTEEIWPDAKDYPADPPAPDDPLQELRPVTDGRLVLAALDGVGPTRANALWNAIREYRKRNYPPDAGFCEADWEPTLAQALVWATAEDTSALRIPRVKGWGKGIRAKVREQMGLQLGMDLQFYWNGKTKSD